MTKFKLFLYSSITIIFGIILLIEIIICTNYCTHSSYEHYKFCQNIEVKNLNRIKAKIFGASIKTIDTSGIPKTFSEYKKRYNNSQTVYSSSIYHQPDFLTRISPAGRIRFKFSNNLPHIKSKDIINREIRLYPYNDLLLFYNKYGNLVFIQVEKNYKCLIYRYDIYGNLAETEYDNGNNVDITFTPDGTPKYAFYFYDCTKYKIPQDTIIMPYKMYMTEAVYILMKAIAVTLFVYLLFFIAIYRSQWKSDGEE